jgi:hypothetical protein
VTLYLRGRTDGFVLKGGDATNGTLTTMYDGARPNCTIAGTCNRHGNHTYQPMSKRGAIILATGGDNSNGAMGKFYEGIMVTGVTDDATDEAVQANIIAVQYVWREKIFLFHSESVGSVTVRGCQFSQPASPVRQPLVSLSV